jgi:hypothetical protein
LGDKLSTFSQILDIHACSAFLNYGGTNGVCLVFVPDDIPNAVKQMYDKVKSNTTAPLYNNWDSYEKHLPRRQMGKHQAKLYKFPYWVSNDHLTSVVDELKKKRIL